MLTQKENNIQKSKLVLAMRVLFTIATFATILFIFSNSVEIAEISGGKSALVTQWLNSVLQSLGFGFQFTEHIVRKLAHFAEFALLGFWMMLTLRVYTRRILSHITIPLFFGLLIPVLDETLQMFVDGRSSQVRDVLIDFSGVMAGIACALFLLLLVRMLQVLHKNKADL